MEAFAGRVTDLEAQISADRRAALAAGAVERLSKAIPRAAGSLHHECQRDAERVVAVAGEFCLALGRLNDRHRSLTVFRLEAEALAARFGISMPALPRDLPPVRLDALIAAVGQVQADGLRNGRNLSERERRRLIAGTAGARLIAEAGPTDDERREAEERSRREAQERAAEAAAMAPFAPLLREAERLDGLPLHRRF